METAQKPGVSPSPSPLLARVHDLLGTCTDSQTLYSISSQALSRLAIDELQHYRCFETPQGWVLALDPASLQTFLWRPQDGERIQLPPKEHGFPERCRCLLSDMPGAASGCSVVVCDLDDSEMWSCKIGAPKWHSHRYQLTRCRGGGVPRVVNIGECQGIAAVRGKIYFEITSYARGVIEFRNEDDDEVLACAVALARRGRGGPRDDHPRVHPRRDDRDDDQDHDGAARRDRRSYGERREADGAVRRERTRSPRRRDAGNGGYGRRHDVDVVMAEAAAATAITPHVPDADLCLRAFIAEQGAMMRAEQMACLNAAVAPVLAESAALRAWQVRALSFLDKACESPSPSQPQHPSPMPSSGPLFAVIADHGAPVVHARGPADGPSGARFVDPAPFMEDASLLGQLELLQLSPRAHELVVEGPGSTSPVQPNSSRPSQLVLEEENEAWDDSLRSPASQGAATAPFLEESLPSQPEPALTPSRQVRAPSLTNYATGDETEPLQEFLSSVAGPVQQPLLGMPSMRKKKKAAAPAGSPRRSGRIAIKKKARQLSDGAVAI
ncbi:hypothetical protein ACQ4PT_012932 [Festuca glaucescens]